MDPRDEAKTLFKIEEGTYFYTRIPFGIKNSRATYQRLQTQDVQRLDRLKHRSLYGWHDGQNETFQR